MADPNPSIPDSERLDRAVRLASTAFFDLDPGHFINLDAFRTALTKRIGVLLNENRHLLLSLLYRIDVREDRVKAVFATVDPADIPARLADLIIERQLQKVETRLRYKSPDADAFGG